MDQALKQRLVGATVLIILGVILLPMLLSGQSDGQNESRRIELPDKPPELSMDKRRFPIGEHAPARPSQVPESQGDEAGAVAASTVDSAEPMPATGGAIPDPEPATERESGGQSDASPVVDQVDTAAVSSAPGPAEVAPGPEVSEARYLVQVASFSKSASAAELSESLTRLGLPVLLENVTTEAGRLHRVRVGPFDTTQQADGAIERIESLKLDLQPRVLDLRPDENAPVTEPSDPLVRWVVQAGVFSSSDNAVRLVDDLRNQGFSAYSEQVSSNGEVVYKVRIGPVAERSRAEVIRADLQARAEIDGRVMSVD